MKNIFFVSTNETFSTGFCFPFMVVSISRMLKINIFVCAYLAKSQINIFVGLCNKMHFVINMLVSLNILLLSIFWNLAKRKLSVLAPVIKTLAPLNSYVVTKWPILTTLTRNYKEQRFLTFLTVRNRSLQWAFSCILLGQQLTHYKMCTFDNNLNVLY